jgi:molybdopterin synthase sulfur carrier subunit
LITVHLSGHLKDYTGRKRDFEIPGTSATSVIALVEHLDKIFPGIRHTILDDQDVTREYVNIFVNGEDVRFVNRENTILKDGDQVHILPAVAGG